MPRGLTALAARSAGSRSDEPLGQRRRRAEEFHDALAAGIALSVASSTSANPEVETIRRQMLAALAPARRRLPLDEQRIIDQHWFEGISLETIGAKLGIGRTAVKARHRRALERLREYMDDWF